MSGEFDDDDYAPPAAFDPQRFVREFARTHRCVQPRRVIGRDCLGQLVFAPEPRTPRDARTAKLIHRPRRKVEQILD